MLASAAHGKSLLAFLAIAEIEKQVRAPLHESSEFSAFLSLVLSLQPELECVAELTAGSSALANAIADGNSNIEPRSFAYSFPREAPKLALATQRLKSSYGEHSISQALVRFHAAISRAKTTTVKVIVDDAMGDVTILKADWREAAAASAHLLREIDSALDQRAIRGLGAASSPLIALLEEVVSGGHSIVAADGTLHLPKVRDGRESKRVPVCSPVTVESMGTSRPAMLRDLSATGLGLSDISGLERGAEIRIEIGPMKLRGLVEWCKDGQAGVSLEAPIEADDPRLRFITRG